MSTPRSYRCTYTPLDRDGWPVPSETGVLPFALVAADNAEDAQRRAYALVGYPIVEVQRLEPQECCIPIGQARELTLEELNSDDRAALIAAATAAEQAAAHAFDEAFDAFLAAAGQEALA